MSLPQRPGSAGGERKFDVQHERKLADACLQPALPIARLLPKVGVLPNGTALEVECTVHGRRHCAREDIDEREGNAKQR